MRRQVEAYFTESELEFLKPLLDTLLDEVWVG